jgi:hypothetical protein
MTREDAAHYSIKHPRGTPVDPSLAEALKQMAPNGLLPCRIAHEIASQFAVPPAEVGKTADLLEHRIIECQMGLFGYSPQKRIVTPAARVDPALREALEQRTVEGVISCFSCWEVAAALGIARMAVASAVESLGLKIKPCQLGAF